MNWTVFGISFFAAFIITMVLWTMWHIDAIEEDCGDPCGIYETLGQDDEGMCFCVVPADILE